MTHNIIEQDHAQRPPGVVSSRETQPRTLRVAVLGCGNIGSALIDAVNASESLELTTVLVRESTRARRVPRTRLRTRIEDVLLDRPDVVVECLGGIEAPAEICTRVLAAGINVVSANKSMIAYALRDLAQTAATSGAQLHFDAAVCAGVPVLDAVARLRSARIRSIAGIVNGTCNFILDRITRSNCTYQEALAQAIELGYAEPNPHADISGRDSAEKACLLAAAAGWGAMHPDSVVVDGLADEHDAITREDLLDIRALGHETRLVARVEVHEATSSLQSSDNATRRVSLTVAPTIVERAGALASALDTANVVSVETELAGTITLRGPGAGARPTVAALLADIEACAQRRAAWVSSTPLTPSSVVEPASPQRALLRVSQGKTALLPQALLDHVSRAGVTLRSIAVTRESALIEVHGCVKTLRLAIASLRGDERRVRAFAIDPRITLRF